MTVLVGSVSNVAPPQGWNLNGFTFDAWLRLNHNTSLTITQHPVETGAAITDHSYINPRRFSFDIGMTDVTRQTSDTQNIAGQSQSRSVNAYNALVAMQYSRQLLTLSSKYSPNNQAFQNVLIESIDVTDDYRTVNAMRATITLLEVILVTSATTGVSAIPQVTDQTNRGQVSPTPINPAYASSAVTYGLAIASAGG